MLSSTFLALGLVPLALAAPQYHGDSASGSENHSLGSESLSSSSSYADYLDVHKYDNEGAYEWAAGKVTEYPVQFCNVSETALIRQGLKEAEILAAHARDHIHRWGNSSSYYKKYFGAAGTAEPAGWFDKIVNTDKTGVIFRCDDPDGNCAANETWAGHWRGENGTDQTVICAPSYSERWHLEQVCMHGWTVTGSPYNQYWASDLHHRLFHTIKIGEGLVDHYADDYVPSLQLAIDTPEEAVRNSHSLALFALDVYAHDVAAPNVGCTGEYVPDEEDEAAAEATSTSTSAAGEATSATESVAEATVAETAAEATAEATAEAATTTVAEPETTITSSEEHCHTHADTGEVHCS